MVSKTPLQAAYSKFRAVVFTTFVFSFAINMLLFVSPLYMLQIYDRVLGSRNETTLLMISLITLFLLVIYGLMEFIRSRMLVRAGLQFDEVLSAAIFSRAVKLRLSNPAAGAEYILSDGDKVREFMTGTGILTFFDAPWTPVFIAICFLFHPWLGYLALAGGIIIFALALINEYATKKQLRDANTAAQGANQFASAVLQNAEVIRSMGMEKALGDRWKSRHTSMLDAQAGASDKSGAIMTFQKFFRMTIQSAILGLGAYLALHQEISPGIMIAASIMMGRALQPVEQGVAQWKQFVSARQAHERLKNLFDKIAGDDQRTELPTPKGLIAVENLTSVIPGSKTPFLKNISFQVNPGETLAVIGPSGSGKSSLIRHMVGVWPAVSGTVRIDGADIAHWDAEQLGQHLGYLPQEVRLFAGTIAENISRFTGGESEAVVKAAQMAGVHDMILRLPDGYETQVGDNGQQLSGGQRQRIGLARAMFGMPRIILLDEPNSNLDSDGENALIEAIKTMKSEAITVVLVTHKTNLLAISDRALVLRDGAMQAFTTPQELFKPANTPVPTISLQQGAVPAQQRA
ncbi:PrtD family type I secretion system ABC transporter [Rhizobium rosettiformans]|uniref:Type I secretion system permease/ATPase n=2 Tax=Rhizobium rosettiformans TaxID=1368430 RepID=A0A4S8PI87_9HYPH|nr:type I secretion system permease/ATPase [Rhizobium rosettiformans]MBB5278659.1 PrtD family type I secretion system ABC transporter [Rhizobium rosettiformans]THV30328.1 type I secretion system permease/ATPase [Rhizobium rosettiformans W3]